VVPQGGRAGAIAGLGYAVDGLGTVLVAGYSTSVASVTFLGEVVLIVCLLVKGVRRRDGRADQDPGVDAVVLDDTTPARKPAGLQH
jgi:membrane protein implicated in regulation of membrane protease activity